MSCLFHFISFHFFFRLGPEKHFSTSSRHDMTTNDCYDLRQSFAWDDSRRPISPSMELRFSPFLLPLVAFCFSMLCHAKTNDGPGFLPFPFLLFLAGYHGTGRTCREPDFAQERGVLNAPWRRL